MTKLRNDLISKSDIPDDISNSNDKIFKELENIKKVLIRDKLAQIYTGNKVTRLRPNEYDFVEQDFSYRNAVCKGSASSPNIGDSGYTNPNSTVTNEIGGTEEVNSRFQSNENTAYTDPGIGREIDLLIFFDSNRRNIDFRKLWTHQ